MTKHQLDIYNFFKKSDYKIINPFERWKDGKYKILGKLPPGKLDLPHDEYYALVEKLIDKMRETLLTDLFVIGANAITMNGEIVSIGGSGNRVAGMIFGPKKKLLISLIKIKLLKIWIRHYIVLEILLLRLIISGTSINIIIDLMRYLV